jgi:methionyl-tRNA formyltransferase
VKLLYVGARVVGRICLEALLEAEAADVVGVLELDAGKAGVTTAFSPFDELIERHGLVRRHFTNLRDPEVTAWCAALEPDVGAVVGVSQLVGDDLLAVPPLGFLGMHPTLLPTGRGRAPIPWALIKGLDETGVSIFRCDAAADRGVIYAQERGPIGYEDPAATLGARTDAVAARLLAETVRGLAGGTAVAVPQDESAATEWPRRRAVDGVIDSAQPGRRVYDFVRALTHPYPGAFTTLDRERLHVWSAVESADARAGRPGEVLARVQDGLLVATGCGNVVLTRVQRDSAPEAPALEAGIPVGAVLGSA